MKKILAVVFLMSNAAVAEDTVSDSERKITYKQKTEIDFVGLDVLGEIVKPSSALVLERKGATFNPLIVLRTDWSDKIYESVDEVK